MNTCAKCQNSFDYALNEVICWSRDSISRYEAMWCDNCVAEHTFKCNVCSRDFNSASFRTYSAGTLTEICSQCFSRDFFICVRCDSNFHNDYRYTYDGDYYCEGCHEYVSDDDDDDYVHSYDYKPRLTFYGDGPMFYGVELELSVDTSYAKEFSEYAPDKLYLKEDSSIYDGGFEAVTHPMSLEVHRQFWKDLFSEDFFKSSDAKASSNGLHVHVNRSGLSTEQIGKIVAFVNMLQNQEFITKIAGRDSTTWAKLDHSKAMSSGGRFTTEDSDRYSAVNLTNDHTIEFRIFRGTVKYTRLMSCLEFVDAVVEYTKNLLVRYPEDLHHSLFISWLKNESLEKYINLRQLSAVS